MSEQLNYNIFALRGDKTVDDADVCDHFGIDQAHAYTPRLNELAVEKMRQDNIAGYIEQGMSESEATATATKRAQSTLSEIDKLIQQRKRS